MQWGTTRAIMHMGLLSLLTLLSSCSFNPFTTRNHLTGNAIGPAIGAGVGAGSMALLHAPKAVTIFAGLGGGAIGYYVTTLRYAASGIIYAGGEVYTLGDYTGIYIPTDKLFEQNSAEFLPTAGFILDSALMVLKRRPCFNIIISGNTSGFGKPSWELKLSQRRAQKVAAFLWRGGINHFEGTKNYTRKLNYVGYGDFFPIASDLSNDGIRANSRIQIVSYPSLADLEMDKRQRLMSNVGSFDPTDDP